VVVHVRMNMWVSHMYLYENSDVHLPAVTADIVIAVSVDIFCMRDTDCDVTTEPHSYIRNGGRT
jgi:hypothetical protein